MSKWECSAMTSSISVGWMSLLSCPGLHEPYFSVRIVPKLPWWHCRNENDSCGILQEKEILSAICDFRDWDIFPGVGIPVGVIGTIAPTSIQARMRNRFPFQDDMRTRSFLLSSCGAVELQVEEELPCPLLKGFPSRYWFKTKMQK